MQHPVYSSFMLVYGIVYAAWCALALRRLAERTSGLSQSADDRRLWVLILLPGLLFRLFTAPFIPGHPIDFADYSQWAQHAASGGLSRFYDGQMFADYPPGYIYVLYFIGLIHQLLSIPYDSPLSGVLLKLPSIAADTAAGWLIYRMARKSQNAKAARILAALYVFNPGIYLNSTLWGQIDSIFTLIVVLMVLAFMRKRIPAAAGLFAAALVVKPQAFLFAPIFLFALAETAAKRSPAETLKSAAASLISGFSVFALSILPFVVDKPPLWIVDHYRAMFASYPYASLNASNLYALAGGNGTQLAEMSFFLNASAWSWLFMALSVIFTAVLFLRGRDSGKYILTALMLMLLVFNLKSGMHERYLYPAVILSLLSYIQFKNKRLLYLFIGLSFTHFVNVAYVFYFSLGQNYWLSKNDILMIILSFGNLALLVYAVKIGWNPHAGQRTRTDLPGLTNPGFAELSASLSVFREPAVKAEDRGDNAGGLLSAPGLPLPEVASAGPAQPREQRNERLSRRDKWLLTGLTLAYAAIALYHLGSFKDPQTYWYPHNIGSSVQADFGAQKQLARMEWFAGIAEGRYRIERSDDAVSWYPVTEIELKVPTVFKWEETDLNVSARYIRITAQQTGAALHEVGFFQKDSDRPLPILGITASVPAKQGEENPDRLFDEQQTVPLHPSFMNSSYFDEVYHARTAYEHLHRMEPYETTHPPLGKIFISLGIALFGLVPFGWRIVGTLFGIAMIPLMYLFGKKLFKRTEFAFIAAFLMTFDFMHFAQTRIATIDVYGVFFIILMFYYMYRYVNLNFHVDGLKKTLVPLFLSGLFFGLGAASKWISIYGGAGLALIYFIHLVGRFKEYIAANRQLRQHPDGSDPGDDSDREDVPDDPKPPVVSGSPKESADSVSGSKDPMLERIVRTFPKNLLLTLLWSVAFFIVIPAIIYVLAYIPYFMVSGKHHGLADLIEAQKYMYNYHKNLVSTHPFASPWWQWPMMLMPIWYFQGSDLPDGMISSIVSMGNPAVWWIGSLAVVFAAVIGFLRKERLVLFLLIALGSEYLPWVLVPRLTFIYHFFASVPFIILLTTYILKDIQEQVRSIRKFRIFAYSYLAAVFVLFAMFYPILSGAVVSRDYAAYFLRWFPFWHFY
ncbi:glycosyltransferase family 39 protein [Ferviditalea candida]|uniref:Glycosyltransferase family 39 protein n=1 Tax=Ferviditalea candida TaxID=3108399 RepID=A0ABU5ZKU6_9BACL|nr:glycosyltransferase family 39 protein [Paenibacillaceae bacterium T2]